MVINRSIFSGCTDYTGATFAEIIAEIKDFKSFVKKGIKELEKFKKSITKPKIIDDFVDRRILGLGNIVDDFDRLINELPARVTPAHIELIDQARILIDEHLYFCQRLKEDIDNITDVDEMLDVDNVRAFAMDLFYGIIDISNLGNRLKTFVGIKSEKRKKQNKSRFKKTESVIDKSEWKCPKDLFFVVDYVGDSRRSTKIKIYCCWANEEKGLRCRTGSQMHSLFSAFADRLEAIPIDTLASALNTKQPTSKAVRDLNDALVERMKRKFPTKREMLPTDLVGYSSENKGYKILIPVYTKKTRDRIDIESLQYNPENEYFDDSFQIKKRG